MPETPVQQHPTHGRRSPLLAAAIVALALAGCGGSERQPPAGGEVRSEASGRATAQECAETRTAARAAAGTRDRGQLRERIRAAAQSCVEARGAGESPETASGGVSPRRRARIEETTRACVRAIERAVAPAGRRERRAVDAAVDACVRAEAETRTRAEEDVQADVRRRARAAP